MVDSGQMYTVQFDDQQQQQKENLVRVNVACLIIIFAILFRMALILGTVLSASGLKVHVHALCDTSLHGHGRARPRHMHLSLALQILSLPRSASATHTHSLSDALSHPSAAKPARMKLPVLAIQRAALV